MIDLLRITLSVLSPPLAVFTKAGFDPPFWVNVLLMIVGYIPGVVHAVWIVGRRYEMAWQTWTA